MAASNTKKLFDADSGPSNADRRAAYRKIMFALNLPKNPRAVLRAIHEHAGLYPEFVLSLSVLADFLDWSVGTVRDAKNWLVRQGLLVEKTRWTVPAGSNCSEQLPSAFTISWFNVASGLPADARAEVMRMLGESPAVFEQPAAEVSESESADEMPIETPGGVVQTAEYPPRNLDHPPQNLDHPLRNLEPCTFSSSLGFSSSLPSLQQPSMSCSAVVSEDEPGEQPPEQPVSSSRGLGNPWGMDITKENLTQPAIVRRLFDVAVAKGWWLDTDLKRLGWATLCVYVAREADHPGKMLTHCAKAGEHKGSAGDESRARRIVDLAWNGIDSQAAADELDRMTESEFRDWLIENGVGDPADRGFDMLVIYGRGPTSSQRPRLVSLMANLLAARRSECVPC